MKSDVTLWRPTRLEIYLKAVREIKIIENKDENRQSKLKCNTMQNTFVVTVMCCLYYVEETEQFICHFLVRVK